MRVALSDVHCVVIPATQASACISDLYFAKRERFVKSVLYPAWLAVFGAATQESEFREVQWPSGRADFSEPGGQEFDSLSRQPQVVAHQH